MLDCALEVRRKIDIRKRAAGNIICSLSRPANIAAVTPVLIATMAVWASGATMKRRDLIKVAGLAAVRPRRSRPLACGPITSTVIDA